MLCVYDELMPSMGTDAFVRCFKCFFALRGIFEIVISDNFNTFLSEQLKQFLAKESYPRKNPIQILEIYSITKSPWWGGFYEPLIRIMKDALKKYEGKSRFLYEELERVLQEIEMTNNS